MWIERSCGDRVVSLASSRPVVLVTGGAADRARARFFRRGFRRPGT